MDCCFCNDRTHFRNNFDKCWGLTPFVKVKMHVHTDYADPSFLRIIFKNAAELTVLSWIKLRVRFGNADDCHVNLITR